MTVKAAGTGRNIFLKGKPLCSLAKEQTSIPLVSFSMIFLAMPYDLYRWFYCNNRSDQSLYNDFKEPDEEPHD
jgi:hypothetical protein